MMDQRAVSNQKSEKKEQNFTKKIADWNEKEVSNWLNSIGFFQYSSAFEKQEIDGLVLNNLEEADLEKIGIGSLAHRKKILHYLHQLQKKQSEKDNQIFGVPKEAQDNFSKLIMAGLYLLLVIFLTAFTMTIVNDRVPDQKTYPPLPDFFLDAIGPIPWAFPLVEALIISLGFYFGIIVILHKHRFVVLRRFAVITASVYLLRCFTMFVTSLAVPGAHLHCEKTSNASLEHKFYVAWGIMMNLGLSMNGVRTCGDYMFSGHTAMLTLLNYVTMEYTPDSWKGVKAITFGINVIGMILVAASHEHYSIDIVIAFFISSRLFLYYHSLANNWTSEKNIPRKDERDLFPGFSYFEEGSRGPIPNEYWNPLQNTKEKTQ